MKLVLALTTLLTSASAAAIPCTHLTSSTLSTVTLRLISSLNTHYTISGSQQTPTTPQGSHLDIIVGQTLSLDHAPLHVQAIEIAQVSVGVDLGTPAQMVGYDDERVVCRAKIGYGSKGVEVRGRDRVVAVGGGDVVEVTGLECWVEE